MAEFNGSEYYIVAADALPEVMRKAAEAKRLIESGREKTIRAAAAAVGISRSAFYKYQNTVFPFYENTRGKTMTIALNLNDTTGLLSDVLNMIAAFGANILTINQTIPLNRVANVTVTVETGKMREPVADLLQKLTDIHGVQSLKIIARE